MEHGAVAPPPSSECEQVDELLIWISQKHQGIGCHEGKGERGITVIFEDRNYSLYFFHMKTIYIQNLKKLCVMDFI